MTDKPIQVGPAVARSLHDVRTETLQVLESLLRGHRDVALLDFPAHMNAGDSLIWAGTMSYLSKLGLAVRYVADKERFSESALRRALPNGPILLHGGGNFGDIWPEYQAFRERVVRSFPERQIIQMPQSIYFNDMREAARANDVMGQHPDFLLLLRETDSISRAAKYLPDVKTLFCHDLGLGWDPGNIGSRKRRSVFVLARRDVEANSNLAGMVRAIERQYPVTDWGLTGWKRVAWRTARVPGRIARVVPLARDAKWMQPFLRTGYRLMLWLNLAAASRLYRTAAGVVTDRLHGHIFAVLFNLPSVVVNNSYGKVTAVREATTKQIAISQVAFSEGELASALEWLEQAAANGFQS